MKNKGVKQMSNQELLNLAKTIKSQIHSTILMCAAARNYAAYEDKDNLYGLQFTISNTSAVKYGTVISSNSSISNLWCLINSGGSSIIIKDNADAHC